MSMQKAHLILSYKHAIAAVFYVAFIFCDIQHISFDEL